MVAVCSLLGRAYYECNDMIPAEIELGIESGEEEE